MTGTANIDLSYEDMQFLLKLFDTQSLTLTASALELSMGAASRRLGHMREVFADELFVRSGMLMLPTTRMRELRGRLMDLVERTEALFSAERFDLKATKRHVRILSADNAVVTFLHPAIKRFYEETPQSRLTVQAMDGRFFDRLREGEADFAFMTAESVPADFHDLVIYRSRRGVLVREDHPLVKAFDERGEMTAEMLAPWRAVRTQQGTLPYSGGSAQFPQDTGCTVPYYLAVPYIVSQTDFTFTAPVITLRHFVTDSGFPLRILPLPEEAELYMPRLVWHHATHTDPFLQWVRGLIVDAARAEAKSLGALVLKY